MSDFTTRFGFARPSSVTWIHKYWDHYCNTKYIIIFLSLYINSGTWYGPVMPEDVVVTWNIRERWVVYCRWLYFHSIRRV